MKFCINCKHYLPDMAMSEPSRQAKFALCARSQNPEDVNLHRIDGREIRPAYCQVERIGKTEEKNCGVDAGWFEPKLDELKKLESVEREVQP